MRPGETTHITGQLFREGPAQSCFDGGGRATSQPGHAAANVFERGGVSSARRSAALGGGVSFGSGGVPSSGSLNGVSTTERASSTSFISPPAAVYHAPGTLGPSVRLRGGACSGGGVPSSGSLGGVFTTERFWEPTYSPRVSTLLISPPVYMASPIGGLGGGATVVTRTSVFAEGINFLGTLAIMAGVVLFLAACASIPSLAAWLVTLLFLAALGSIVAGCTCFAAAT